MLKRAVFLDKDGTLIEDVPYNVDPNRIRLVDGALEGLRRLHGAGYELVIVTNQSGVARGYFAEEELRGVEDALRQRLAEGSVPLAGFYYCPHHPQGTVKRYRRRCACRKPAPGMLLQAAREQGIDLTASWFIGDILNDVEAGRRAECRTILIDNGNETVWELSSLRKPHYTVGGFPEAADTVLGQSRWPISAAQSLRASPATERMAAR